MRSTVLCSALAASLLVGATVGCGGDENDDEAEAPSTAESALPTELAGTYLMTLKPSDVPTDPPPELTDNAEKWTLEIANTGGPDGGPAFTIINDQLGTLESSRLEVIDDRILLHDEECAVAPAPVESEYQWKLSGNTLRFAEMRNGCKDDVVLTLLTSEPWLRHR